MTVENQLQEAADKATQASAQAEVWAKGGVGVTVPTDSGPVPTIAEFTRAAQERADNAIDALGWVLAGDFTAGCTITDRNQYVLVVGGAGYRWDGVIPPGGKVVTPGSSPTPIATGSWVNIGDATLSGDVAISKLKQGSFVVPEQFGTASNPASTAAMLNAAANHCRTTGATLFAGVNAYTISSDVNLRSVSLDFSDTIVTVEDGCMLTVGGDAGTRINPSQKIKAVKKPRAWSLNPADYPVASLRVMGSKAQTITIEQVDRVLFYMSTNPATYPSDASQAYSKFKFDVAIVIDIDTDPTYAAGPQADGPSSANQWFNENQFYLGSNVAFLMRGSYPHNNNRVHGGCYETANAIINIESGNKNWWTDTRLEGAASVAFGVNTLGNIIDASWFSSTAQIYQRPPAGGAVTDNGVLNLVRDVRVPPSASDCIMLVTSRDTIHNGQPSNYNFRSSTRRAIRSVPRTTARIIGDTDFIDAVPGDYFFASLESLSGLSSSYILRIYLYDSQFQVIPGNKANLDTSSFTNIFSDRVEGRVNNALEHHRFGILNSSCRYVRVELLTSGSTSEDNAVRVQINRVSRAPGRSRQSEIKNTKTGRFGFVTSTPTQFVGQVGDLIAGLTTDFRCVFFLETTLTVAASSSATVITTVATSVSGLGSVVVNDLIGVDMDDGTTHWTTVSAIGGGNITLTAGLISAAAIGSRAYISRLAAR